MKLRLRWAVFAWFCMVLSGMAQNAATSSASVSVPAVIQFSNVATDEGGTPLSGTVSITFSLYNSAVGGQALWTETQNVQLGNAGQYSAYLGLTQANGLPANLFTSGQAQWLGVKIESQPEQARVFLVSVPYAMKAGDAATIGGLPPSAFVMAAAPSGPGTAAEGTEGNAASGITPATNGDVTGLGTVDYIPIWDSTSDIISSVLFQSGTGSTAKIGINTTTPASTLDVKGGGTIRGTLTLPASGAATATAGKNSQPLSLTASAFNSTDSTAVNQVFQWEAMPAANDTSAPSGTLNLLFGEGATAPSKTGFSIASNGQITFATGQTFPGTGDGTVTSVASGTGITGGPITSSGTLQIDPTVVPQLDAASNTFTGSITASGFTGSGANVTNVNAAELNGFTSSAFQPAGSYATLGANSFSGNQTVNGNILLPFVNPAGTVGEIQMGGYAFAFGSYGPQTAFLGFAGNPSQTGLDNTAVGAQALLGNTSGSYDTANGSGALYSNTTGGNNTASGFEALLSNTTGGNNTASGFEALHVNTTGGNNTAAGYGAGTTADSSAITGSGNSFFGAKALLPSGSISGTPISNATAIGANAEVGESNAIVLGGITGTNGGTSVDVGIGTTTPAYTLDVHGTGNFTGLVTFAGTQTFPGTITGVTAGAGLSESGTGNITLTNTGILALTAGTGISSSGGQSPTISINTAVVPELSAANTFTGNQTVNGAVSATTGFEIGGVLFDYGTPYNSENQTGGSAFLGFAGNTTTTGAFNTASGFEALGSLTTGPQNTASGAKALANNTTGGDNTAVGYATLIIDTTGGNNTAVGYLAGQALYSPYTSTGSNNSFFGSAAALESAVDSNGNPISNATVIGANAVAYESNALVLGSEANVGIGTSIPAGPLHINGPYGAPGNALPSGNNGLLFGTNGDLSYKWIQSYGGALALNPEGNDVGIGTNNPTHLLSMGDGAYESGGVWTNASDRNLKEAFASIDGAGLLAKLNAIPMQTWKYKTEKSGIRHLGPMAQDFRAAFGLGEDDRHISTVDEGGVALAAIQQLYRDGLRKDAIIRRQQAQIAQLMSQVKTIQATLRTRARSGSQIHAAKAQAAILQR
jgi:hypothetical protein